MIPNLYGDIGCRWFVFAEGSDANARLQTLPGVDPDHDAEVLNCADGVRRGLWSIKDTDLLLRTIKRERGNGLQVAIFWSRDGSKPRRYRLGDADVVPRRKKGYRKWVGRRGVKVFNSRRPKPPQF